MPHEIIDLLQLNEYERKQWSKTPLTLHDVCGFAFEVSPDISIQDALKVVAFVDSELSQIFSGSEYTWAHGRAVLECAGAIGAPDAQKLWPEH